MATHSVLGVEFPDGTINACYVHWDGDTVGDRVKSYLENQTTTCLALSISNAQRVGGMRSFPVKNSDDLLDDNQSYNISESDFWDDHMCTSYWYLVNYQTGKIIKRSS